MPFVRFFMHRNGKLEAYLISDILYQVRPQRFANLPWNDILNADTMENLIAEETIEIEAPVSVIWDLLTDPDKIRKWSPGKMDFKNEDVLEMGNEMYWKNANGKTAAKGTIIEIEPERYIRISMHFADWDKEADTDALTHIYSIFQKNRKITLTHTYGDFAKVPQGKKIYDEYIAAVTPENTALKKIKEMAEE